MPCDGSVRRVDPSPGCPDRALALDDSRPPLESRLGWCVVGDKNRLLDGYPCRHCVHRNDVGPAVVRQSGRCRRPNRHEGLRRQTLHVLGQVRRRNKRSGALVPSRRPLAAHFRRRKRRWYWPAGIDQTEELGQGASLERTEFLRRGVQWRQKKRRNPLQAQA